jgi:hypothetical protein
MNTRNGAESTVFEVAMRPGAGSGTFTVEVMRSPAGEGTSVVDFAVDELLARRSAFQQALRPGPQAEQPIREIGEALFTALLGTGEVGRLYHTSAALAAERDRAFRVVLRIDSPELADLPWEAMYDKSSGTYVCRQVQLVRYVPVPVAPAPLEVSPPLRVLGVISAPRGMDALDVGKERGLLETALAEPIAGGLAEITWAPTATWEDLHALLMAGPWHVLHFIGHGNFDTALGEGILAFTRPSGYPDLVEASRFTDLLRQAQPMPRLVVLNSCSGAASGTSDLFAGTAYALVRSGIPAVAAMQFRISDKAASAFARGFYGAIARQRGVDNAVSAARVAILGTRRGTMEWITPALFLRGDRAHLFTDTAPAGTARSAPTTAQTAQTAAGDPSTGHVFISYNGQDSVHADRLQQLLENAGLHVWRDTENLWSGLDWRTQIRRAITADALVFLACFSRASTAETKSRQNEELVWAIDELRQRNPEIPWLIPVRFDECQVPDLYIGAGRTLSDIQPASMFGTRADVSAQRLVQVIQRILTASKS